MNKSTVKEYVNRLQSIENEIELLKSDKKTLKEEFEEKLDLKAVHAALRIAKIRADSDEAGVDLVLDILGDAAIDDV